MNYQHYKLSNNVSYKNRFIKKCCYLTNRYNEYCKLLSVTNCGHIFVLSYNDKLNEVYCDVCSRYEFLNTNVKSIIQSPIRFYYEGVVNRTIRYKIFKVLIAYTRNMTFIITSPIKYYFKNKYYSSHRNFTILIHNARIIFIL